MGSTASINFTIEVEMSSKSLQDWNFMYWNEGLGIPTLPWIGPFLTMMELPAKIAAQPELWIDLYARTRVMHPALDDFPDQQQLLTQERLLLKSAFDELLLRSDLETVNGLLHWFHRHFRNWNLSLAIQQWQFVLTRVIWPSNHLLPQISYPPCFEPLTTEIAELVWHEQEKMRLVLLQMPVTFLVPTEDRDLIEMRRMALEQKPENGMVGDSEGNPFGDASTVHTVICRELTIKAIKLINHHPERKELMRWLYEISLILGTYELEFSDVEALNLYDDFLFYDRTIE
jgi:hypothetical protein